MLEIKKSIVVDKSFYIQSMSSTVGDTYLNYVLKAHLLENQEIYLEGTPVLGVGNFNLISKQKKIIENNLELNRTIKGSIELINYSRESMKYCENCLSLLNTIEEKLRK